MKFAEKGDGELLRHPRCFLLTDAQLGDQGTIALDILLLQIVQQAAALTDHLQQTTVGVLVLGVGAHVLGEDVDALGEDGDLDLGGTGVGLVGTVGLDHGRFLIFTQHSVFPPFKIFSADCAMGVVKASAKRSHGSVHGLRAEQVYHRNILL